MQRLHIAIVSEYCRPWPGGIAEHVHYETMALLNRGHRVTLVTGPMPELSTTSAIESTRPEETPDVVRLDRTLTFTGNGAASLLAYDARLLRMQRVWSRLAPDVVHVHAPLDPLLPLLSVLTSPVPVVGTFHASFPHSWKWQALYGKLAPWATLAFNRLSRRIAVSEEAKRCIERYQTGHFDIIPNGVDTARFMPQRRADAGTLTGGSRNSEHQTILFVGRADPRKGLAVLCRAFALLQARRPNLKLLVAGPIKAEDEHQLREQHGLHCRTTVQFLGYVPIDELPNLYRTCNVFCSPALMGESQGIVLLEAMAAHCPPVAFDIPGYRDVIRHGQNGLLVSSKTPEALADALQTVLDNRALHTQLVKGGTETSDRYDWSSVAKRLEQTLVDATLPQHPLTLAKEVAT